jgi:asparagine synthase (glutamine-hydrolysing)
MPFAPEPADRGAMEHFRDRTRSALQVAIADVAEGRRDVGVLLSGGVDSSVLAAVARETVGRCVGFVGKIQGSQNTEMERALIVARHLGIECHVVDVPAPLVEPELRSMVRRIEEPPRHPNNFVLARLLKFAAGEVDLVLQGDGAEMLFGLADSRRVARFRRKHAVVVGVPRALRRRAAQFLERRDESLAWRLAHVLDWDATTYAANLDAITYTRPVQRALQRALAAAAYLPLEHFAEHQQFDDALQAYQAYTFLMPSLVRHDRLAQPLGLRSESPFLRNPVSDLACRIPRELRFVAGSKPVLRALCDHYLPAEVSHWPKLGFPVPWQDWVREAFPRADALAAAARFLPRGFLSSAFEMGDVEALWTAASLAMLVEEFNVDPGRR